MQTQTQQRFASSTPVGSASVREKSTSKLSIMNPFRRQQNPSSSSSSSNTLPPPAYSTNPSSSASVATSKRRPSSLFSWKSKRLSWSGFGSSKGEKSEQVSVVNKSQRKGKSAPAMPSAASNMVSIWKRRDPQVEFDFQPPFVVEFDPSTPIPPTPEPTSNQPNRSLSPPASHSFPSRTTYSPSPTPSVTFDSKLAKSIPRATHSSAVFPSQTTKPVKKSDIRTFKIVEEEEVRSLPTLSPEIPSTSSAPQASPDIIKHAFADKFPLPPARRPSSAELVAVSSTPTPPRSIPLPTKSLLAPSRNHSSSRPATSSLPRPKNGPYTASNPYPSSPTNSTFKSRLPTPSSITSATSSVDARSPSRTSIPLPSNRKPIVIPARIRPSEVSPQSRVSVLANNDDRSVRNSWSSSTTAMRNSGASGDSDDTVISKPTADSIDLRKRTSLIIPVVEASRGNEKGHEVRRGNEKRKSEVTVEEKKQKEEMEEILSEWRMQDLLIQLGI